MRSPEHQQVAPPRAGRQFEDELQLHYLAPGAFTVLPPERRHPPDPPPTAPEPYRLTPGTKRHKKPSFAIIGDIDSNTLTSDSSSFTGRVSPFRGRGFNPHGSRHASRQSSPTPSSPPPEDARLTPSGSSPSKIPLPQKKEALGEKGHRGGARRRISNKLSQSLSDLDVDEQRGVAQNAKKRVYTKATGFQRLSPIIGSSPEPSQSMSSPSRIPRSQSTPPSRKPSPSRYISSTSSKPPLSNSSVHRSRSQSRIQSRNASRNPSRTASRETSPTKLTTSPSRIPLSKYKNIQAKVDSNNKPKPKVLPKPEVTSDESEPAKPKLRTPLSRKESVNRMRSDSRPNLLPKTGNYAKNNYNSTSDSSVGGRDSSKGSINKNSASTAPSSNNNVINKGRIPKRDQVIEKTAEEAITNSDNSSSVKSSNAKSNDPNKSDSNAVGSNEVKPQMPPINEITSKAELEFKPDNLPSTATAVSSTTSTVAKPLKIETNLNFPEHTEKPKPRSPMIDGRVLSATSVSNAMNRMNDTVLDTQTLMRDRGFSKLSPAANAVISVANEANAALDTKNATSALPTVEPLPKNGEKTTPKNNHAAKNHNGHAKQIEHVLSSKALELEVQKHMQKLITPERKVGSNGRSVVTSDVQPIQIMVKEKPSDVEVQSGNIRPVISVSNGTTERPGLPPNQATPPNEPEKEPPQKNTCTKLLTSCKSKLCCCCAASDIKKSVEKNGSNVGCFACLKKKPAPATIIIEDEMDRKAKLLDRLNCCKSQKVGDMSCFPKSKRKENWAERRDSILSAPTPPRSKSKNFIRKMFCMDLCCKKKGIQEIERKPSLVSKKKSLTLTTALPPEDNSPKIDLSLVEHSSHMKAAIPILPICLAWFCLVMNCLVPGSGTILSGLFCLCMGIPRFSQKDGARPRIGSFLINVIIGVGQFFTVLFCLVGWGWSIWWGVIMVKIAKKHKKCKHLEAIEAAGSMPSINSNNREISQQKRT